MVWKTIKQKTYHAIFLVFLFIVYAWKVILGTERRSIDVPESGNNFFICNFLMCKQTIKNSWKKIKKNNLFYKLGLKVWG